MVHFPDFATIKDNQVLELAKIEQFYGANCRQVLVTYWTSDMHKYYNGPLNLIKFSNHNYDLCKELAANFDQWKHILNQPRTHAWQCLNGRLCVNRVAVAELLKTFDRGWLSLGKTMPTDWMTQVCVKVAQSFNNAEHVESAADRHAKWLAKSKSWNVPESMFKFMREVYRLNGGKLVIPADGPELELDKGIWVDPNLIPNHKNLYRNPIEIKEQQHEFA